MRKPRLLTIAITCVATVSSLAGTANAGTYDVYTCDANRGGATPGWSVSVSPGFTAYGACGGAGPEGLIARTIPSSGASSSFLQAGQAHFDAPDGTIIESVHTYISLSRLGCNWSSGLLASDVGGANARWVFGLQANYCGAHSWSWTYFDWAVNAKRLSLTVACGASSCDRSGETRAAIRDTRITIYDPTPPNLSNPRGDLWTSGGWIAGTRQVAFDASDGAGIRRNVVRVDDQPLRVFDTACNDTHPAPCPNQGFDVAVDTSKLSDGAHKLTLETVDSAGNPTATSKSIQVDNSAPGAPSGLAVTGGDGWRSTNDFAVSWSNPPAGSGAPVAGAHYRLCRASGGNCVTGSRDGAGLAGVDSLQVPAAGDWELTVWLRDAAGNNDPAQTAQARLRFDPTAPDVAFDSPNPSDPTLVTARVSDSDSGVVEGRIEIRKRGTDTWQTLPSSLEGGVVSARIDDEHLAAGRYRLRAWAKDAAGNERSSGDLAEGGAAAVRLPLRVRTEIKAGAASRSVRSRRSAVRVPFGKPVRLGGQLRTAEGNPIADSEVIVFSRLRIPGSPWKAVASIRTSRRGYFAYRAPKGVSRTIRFRFGGTPTIRPSIRHVRMLVRARSSIRAARRTLVNGEYVHLRGRVKGGIIPAEGKLIEIQVLLRGHWRTFATTRSEPNGRWRHQYRFDGTRGTQTYRMRVRLPQESAFPFAAGRSRALSIRVRGL
jgi:hypothetical protein